MSSGAEFVPKEMEGRSGGGMRASVQCPKCKSSDFLPAGRREFGVLILTACLAFPVLVLVAFGFEYVSGVGSRSALSSFSLIEWISLPRLAFLAVFPLAWVFFQGFVQLPKLRFCRSCGAGFAVRELESQEALAAPAVHEAWEATWKAWRAGLYSSNAQQEASGLSLDSFKNKYKSYARLVAVATKHRPLQMNEFIVRLGEDDSFLLTNLTFYLFTTDNPLPNPPLVISLCEVDSYEKMFLGEVVIRLRSGQVVKGHSHFAPDAQVFRNFVNAARGEAKEQILPRG